LQRQGKSTFRRSPNPGCPPNGDSRTTVTINHEEIPGFMDAMAMPYLVEDPSLVSGLETDRK